MINETSKFINDGSIRFTTDRNYKRIMVVNCCTDITVYCNTLDSVHDSSCVTS